ncbi:MAG TPA: DUF3047 domain-containing protein [Methylomirabilota bacterium]|nr:DUF3047 domain-containing protein [Methylomirabilota bacterium]
MRHRVAAVVAVLLLASAAWAVDQVLVEDWTKQAVGHKGIPEGWKAQNWGSPKYDNLVIVENSGKKVLHLKSQDDSTTINKDIKGKVSLKETPILEWTWKSVMLPRGANSCVSATDDQAGQIFVTWPRFPEAVRSRIIGYVWDTTQPVGTICKSEKTGMITYVVVRSGLADLGKWVTERRNVVEDFRKIYGDAPDDPGAVSVSIDSNDTHSTSEAMMGTILFRKP